VAAGKRVSTLGEHTRAHAVWPWKLQHRHMGHAELFEASGDELRDDPAVNGLGRHA